MPLPPFGLLGTECKCTPSARMCPEGEVEWAAAPQTAVPLGVVSRSPRLPQQLSDQDLRPQGHPAPESPS